MFLRKLFTKDKKDCLTTEDLYLQYHESFVLRSKIFENEWRSTLPPLRMLIITDTHNCIQEEWLDAIDDVYYDICFFLGDIGGRDYEAILPHIKAPFYGFPGNHDDIETLEKYNVPNIHGKVIEINGVSIAGWGGSLWYKNGVDISFTQEESLSFAEALESADILLSHDSIYGISSTKDPVHYGLKGIEKYCTEKRPSFNIHGHHHKNAVYYLEDTKIVGIFRCAIVDEAGNSNILF